MPLPQATSIANLNVIQLKTKELQSKNIFFSVILTSLTQLTHSQVQNPKGTQDWWVLVGSCWVLVSSASCSVPVLVSMSVTVCLML